MSVSTEIEIDRWLRTDIGFEEENISMDRIWNDLTSVSSSLATPSSTSSISANSSPMETTPSLPISTPTSSMGNQNPFLSKSSQSNPALIPKVTNPKSQEDLYSSVALFANNSSSSISSNGPPMHNAPPAPSQPINVTLPSSSLSTTNPPPISSPSTTNTKTRKPPAKRLKTNKDAPTPTNTTSPATSNQQPNPPSSSATHLPNAASYQYIGSAINPTTNPNNPINSSTNPSFGVQPSMYGRVGQPNLNPTRPTGSNQPNTVQPTGPSPSIIPTSNINPPQTGMQPATNMSMGMTNLPSNAPQSNVQTNMSNNNNAQPGPASLKTFLQFVYHVTRTKQPEMHNKIFSIVKVHEKHPSEIIKTLRDMIGTKNFEVLRTEFINRIQQRAGQVGQVGQVGQTPGSAPPQTQSAPLQITGVKRPAEN